TRLLNAATVLAILLLCAVNAPLAGVRRWHGLGYPVASLLFLFILWRSTLVTLWTGGIDWRGTHYPLAELKANKV
ncbi:MAG: glycosyl transferase, partial [Thermoanaerobaculia bacterium]